MEGRISATGPLHIYLPTPEEWPLLKKVLELDSRFDSYINTVIPTRQMRSTIDGGKATLVEVRDGDFGYQQDIDRWNGNQRIVHPFSEAAIEWQGWGTALKPLMEAIVLARKPLSEQTVAANVLKYGTGAINIDGCRIGTAGGCRTDQQDTGNWKFFGEASEKRKANRYGGGMNAVAAPMVPGLGRWPANVIVDEEVAEMLGDASPYYYCAKASQSERRGSKHPTIKPLKLMRYLCKLVTPPGGTILDPYAGSGTTGEAALLEGFHSILIEREAQYIADIEKRLSAPMDIRSVPTVTSQGRNKVIVMSDQKETPPSKRDELAERDGIRRSENGRRIIDCEKCGAKDVEEGAFDLCFTCYRREQRAKQKKATNMTLPAQRREQLRVMKLFSALEQAAVGLGFDEEDIGRLRLLASPYVKVVPWIFGEGSDTVNSEQDAA